MLKENAFKIMEDKIRSAKNRGIQPIIILDEIQLLKNIYLNGERYLIDEVFNLFVRLTKVKHLAHVVCLSLDSYFIEEIFNNSKLSVTSTFYHVDHFDEETNSKWLKEEDLESAEIEIMWNYFGGSPWHIWQVLVAYKRGDGELKELCETMLETTAGQVYEFRRLLTKDQKAVFDKISKNIIKTGSYKITDNDTEVFNEVLIKAVEQDVWFYQTKTHKITANSRVVQKALSRL
jgi:uncharacterized protein